MKFQIVYADLNTPEIITHRLCRNPNYGGIATGIPGTVGVPIKKARKPRTREAIKASVDINGFRNPIVVYNTVEGVFLSFGGGRLQAAQELDIPIPCIVVDYVFEWPLSTAPEVTPDNWQEYFTDVPTLFEFTDYGIDTHYGLERNRNNEYDPAGVAWAKDSPEYMEAVLDESEWLDDGLL